MANLDGPSVPIVNSANIERAALLWHPENAVEGEALRHAFEAAYDVKVEPMEHIEENNFERGWIMKLDKSLTTQGDKQVVLWASSHVPPYDGGRGKHGISRLLRFVSAPSTKNSLGGEKELADYVRWHCRISHVTAHTPTLTLDTKIFNQKSETMSTLERIWDFLGLEKSDARMANAESDLVRYLAEHNPAQE